MLVAIIDLEHPLMRLAERIDWGFLERRFGAVYRPGAGPPLPTRLMAGLAILKHMHSLSDKALRGRWLEPVFPVLLRRAQLPACAPLRPLMLDPLATADGRTAAGGVAAGEPFGGAPERSDREHGPWVAVDTTVLPKTMALPTDARLTHRALVKLLALAKRTGVALRQSYAGVAKRAAILVGRYPHAHSSTAPAGSCASCAPGWGG